MPTKKPPKKPTHYPTLPRVVVVRATPSTIKVPEKHAATVRRLGRGILGAGVRLATVRVAEILESGDQELIARLFPEGIDSVSIPY